MLTAEQTANYDQMSIRKLDLEIKKNGFTYRQLKRTNEKFIYSQHNGCGVIVAYEIFYNRLGDLRRAKERWAKLGNKPFNPQDYEEFYEIYPSDEEWGKRAWTWKTLDKAMLAFESK